MDLGHYAGLRRVRGRTRPGEIRTPSRRRERRRTQEHNSEEGQRLSRMSKEGSATSVLLDSERYSEQTAHPPTATGILTLPNLPGRQNPPVRKYTGPGSRPDPSATTLDAIPRDEDAWMLKRIVWTC